MTNITAIPTGVPVTVRVKGQSKRLTRVTLVRIPGVTDQVLVRTGKRGRPGRLNLDRISEVKVLTTA